MRAFRVFGVSGVVVFALGASTAVSAWASGTRVAWESGGNVVRDGTATYGEVVLAVGGYACVDVSRSGSVDINDAAKDRANFSSGDEETRCEAGASITGAMERITMKGEGQQAVRTNPKLTITIPGPCLYGVRKLEGVAAIPGFSDAQVAGVGRRAPGSSSSCAKTVMTEGEVQLFDGETDELFETAAVM